MNQLSVLSHGYEPMAIVDLLPEHLDGLALQPIQASLADTLQDAGYRQELCRYDSFAGIIDGRVVGAAGLAPAAIGRGVAWALFTVMSRRQFYHIHRAVLEYLDRSEVRRIETWVDVKHDAGIYWAMKLGFNCEGCMQAFLPSGGDAWLFARVR